MEDGRWRMENPGIPHSRFHGRIVAQASESAVPRVSNPQNARRFPGPADWKSAVQQVWKPALPGSPRCVLCDAAPDGALGGAARAATEMSHLRCSICAIRTCAAMPLLTELWACCSARAATEMSHLRCSIWAIRAASLLSTARFPHTPSPVGAKYLSSSNRFPHANQAP